ncbi:hypothetical protein BKH42_07370 [Helicobacter sp. 13S00482-2]|nr:hypothetical protein BKH42_07370 [Helicobacter sp. 13S00482-2]
MIMVADCNPILIYDPNIESFALIHAGRKGLMNSIIPKTIHKMIASYGGKPENMMVFVGASIRKCCYEINKELAQSFKKSYINENDSKFKLDMIKWIQDQLFKCHIQRENIQILPTCSCCETNLFSYRRDCITGRFGLLVKLL